MIMQEKFWQDISIYAKEQGISTFFKNQENIKAVWDEFGPKDWLPIIGKDGAIGFPVSKNVHEFIALSTFIQHLIWLWELRATSGVSVLKSNLQNRTQYLDTLFEIKSAYCSTKTPNVNNLEFGPSIINAKGKEKRSDFKFTFGGIEFFCECKRKGESKRANENRALKLMEIIREDVEAAVPENFRAEIYFKSLPSNHQTSLKGYLAAAAKTLVEKRYYESCTLEEAGTGRETILYVRPKTMARAMNVGLTVGYFGATKIINPIGNEDKASILVSIENSNAPNEIKKLIKEANDQLPVNKPGIIFIQAFEITQIDAMDVAKSIIEDKKYANVACIVIECQLFNIYVCAYSSHYPILLNFFDKKF